mmetsp:Transcript_49458/g.163849  ORF Transcript_49458/g.163849 Transcript_49458/m.163849 type:complete len:345 (+) Transcript_49458:29-1063(+)
MPTSNLKHKNSVREGSPCTCRTSLRCYLLLWPVAVARERPRPAVRNGHKYSSPPPRGSLARLGDAQALVVHEGEGPLLAAHHERLRGERRAVRLGEREEAGVRDAVEEGRLADEPLLEPRVHLGGRQRRDQLRRVGGHVPAPLVEEGVDGVLVRRHRGEDGAQRRVDRRPHEPVLLDARRARLRHKDAARVELGAEHLVELGGVELVARAALERVVQVHDDDVEPVLLLLQHRLCVVDDELQPRVGKGCGILGEVVLAKGHHVRVNVDHHAALDRLVPQHLARGRALAAAADVDAPRVRVGKQRGVDQRLVVDKLVALRRLDEAVDHQRAAKRLQVDKVDGLEL